MKRITVIELIIVLFVVIIAITAWTYKKAERELPEYNCSVTFPMVETGKPVIFEAPPFFSGNEKALKEYENILKEEAENEEALVYKGAHCFQLGKYEEALKCTDKLIEINPKYPLYWYNRGRTLEILENYEEAINCYNKMKSCSTDDIDFRIAEDAIERLLKSKSIENL